ncbi:acetyl-CoA C-acyltransferase [Microbulbifer spongiae]|uniref:Acetyl-CoA C-acyltransferase n=1 Tax=Microbulbifer spongiae TaxID=2944933 RepID=A0ABY9EGR7_9GAMM|nr:acetyl-CoA C-acyltransferase [Microbulbifer sp. MI-G]WKD51527.1 acetyl-CoA C-acyltransferase [Microbulbifer sp. MI-G]
MNSAYIYDAIRSPRGRAKASGGLYDLTSLELMKQLYEALESRTGLDKGRVQDVILGCVTQSGEQAANIAKTSLLYAGWPQQVPGITLNRFCSSGLDAINFAALKVSAGQASSVLAGGVEVMSRIPMLSDRASVFTDAALAARCRMLMMGSGADLVASLYAVSRQEADALALQSQQRAARARDAGWFSSIVPISNIVKGIVIKTDECIRDNTTLESLAQLPAAFAELGANGVDAMQLQSVEGLSDIRHIHTAGNSPAMADGAALLWIGNAQLGRDMGLPRRARIRAAVSLCDDLMTVNTGCVKAVGTLMQQQGLSVADVDLFELHEAFAATVIKCRRDLEIDEDKLNVNGGVIALGHPMGATGAVMAGTLLDELERRDLQLGIVAASGAAGTGTALLIERC